MMNTDFQAGWQQAMREAERRATAEGRGDVVEYLRLRLLNDAARKLGGEWLLEVFQNTAAEANRRAAGLTLEHTAPHQFQFNSATLHGARLVLRAGVRSVTVEVGSPRTPPDGFIRGGGLAAARITHFGDAKSNVELLLLHDANKSLSWYKTVDGAVDTTHRFDEQDVGWHVARITN